jgi:POT family proton-dependent oligopeptide transporter
VNTKPLYDGLASIAPWLAQAIGTENGTISAEMMTTLPPLYIILFQVFVSNTVKNGVLLLP